jgi:hypothetical protein
VISARRASTTTVNSATLTLQTGRLVQILIWTELRGQDRRWVVLGWHRARGPKSQERISKVRLGSFPSGFGVNGMSRSLQDDCVWFCHQKMVVKASLKAQSTTTLGDLFRKDVQVVGAVAQASTLACAPMKERSPHVQRW